MRQGPGCGAHSPEEVAARGAGPHGGVPRGVPGPTPASHPSSAPASGVGGSAPQARPSWVPGGGAARGEGVGAPVLAWRRLSFQSPARGPAGSGGSPQRGLLLGWGWGLGWGEVPSFWESRHVVSQMDHIYQKQLRKKRAHSSHHCRRPPARGVGVRFPGSLSSGNGETWDGWAFMPLLSF